MVGDVGGQLSGGETQRISIGERLFLLAAVNEPISGCFREKNLSF
jgi:hypothetical protein